jgi:5-methylcytosine-specific restriction endonuclease McrA
MVRAITESEVISAIKKLAEQKGRSPSSGEFSDEAEFSLSPVWRLFDSWEDAVNAAGLEHLNYRKVRQETPKQELLDALRDDIERFGHVPGKKKMDKDGTYTGATYRNRFGSWNNALHTAGLPVKKRTNSDRQVPCYTCGDSIRRWEWELETRDNVFCDRECFNKAKKTRPCAICGKKAEVSLTSSNDRAYCSDACRDKAKKEFYSETRHCSNCKTEFMAEKWKRGQEDVFCSQECFHGHGKLSRQELIEDFARSYEQLPDTASRVDIVHNAGHSSPTYYEHFESLQEVVEICGIELPYGLGSIECDQCGCNFEGRKKRLVENKNNFCNRECYFNFVRQGGARDHEKGPEPYYGPNWYKQRELARSRDNHTCQSCGVTRDQHLEVYNQQPHVHHINPWHEYDDYEERNDLSNLITLCIPCHNLWERLPVRPEIAEKEGLKS